MTTPFDKAITAIALARYHNHRLETHSDTVSTQIYSDLVAFCPPLREDLNSGEVDMWLNVSAPGDRRRKVDLVIGEPDREGNTRIDLIRIAIENKSVITAHRNRTNRFDDLSKVLAAIHSARPEALLVATVLVGLCRQVLNIPDQVKKIFRNKPEEFEKTVLPRLSSGDASLWKEFDWAVSDNSATDPQRTVDMMRTLPTRSAGHTHVEGYDAVLLVPVEIDNVNPPCLPRPNSLGIDVDVEYSRTLEKMCSAYTARWHM
jgi:hypothetical protein